MIVKSTKDFNILKTRMVKS